MARVRFDMAVAVGRLLRAARVDRGIGVAELARTLWTSPSSIRATERGEFLESSERLKRHARAVGVSARSLAAIMDASLR